MEVQGKPNVRIIKGSRVSSKTEIERFLASFSDRPGFLAGSVSNFEAVSRDKRLYDKDKDLFGNIEFQIPADFFPNVNVVIGAMGSGKTKGAFDNLQAAYPDHHKVIHDPKTEQIVKFYNPAKGDIIIGHPDARSVIWDILGEIRKDKQKAMSIFLNMLLVIQGESKEKQWANYAAGDLTWMATETLKLAKSPADYAEIWFDCYVKRKRQAGDDSLKTGSLGTAEPVVNLIFQMYHIADQDKRRLVTVEDIANARNVFLCNRTDFAQQLSIINNALLAMLVAYDMARPSVERGDVEKYIFYLLDEFLTFRLDPDSEKSLLTLCRDRGISVWLGMQYLPHDKERLKAVMASNYARVVYSSGDTDTIEYFSKSSDAIVYQFYAPKESVGTGQESLLGGPTFNKNDDWVNVDTRQITEDVISQMTPYVAYLELKINEPGIPKLKIKTFLKPVHMITPARNPQWVESEVAKNAPFISEFLVGHNNEDEEVANG